MQRPMNDHHRMEGDSGLEIRETEVGPCRICGRDHSQWEDGFSVERIARALQADPGLLDALMIRRCEGCGTEYDWDVVIPAEGSPDDYPSLAKVQAALLARWREELSAGADPAVMARTARRDLAVTGIRVERWSEVRRRLERSLPRG